MINNYNDKVSHITQSFQWEEFRKTTGVKVLRLDNLTLYLHQIPHLPFYIGYLPRPAELNKEILNKILVLGKENMCIFIKIDPDLNQLINKSTNQLINKSKSILPQHTFFIDLTKAEDELLKAMEPKTRYNIKVAQKHGVLIKEGKTEKDLAEFIKILEDTEKRQGFFSHPADYYRKLWQILRPANMVYLLLAYPPQQFNNLTMPALSEAMHQTVRGEVEGKQFNNETIVPIASLMLFKFKDTLYYPYGGSLDKYRNLMPNYLLHWEAIKLGKKLGCKTYDLWGAFLNRPDPSDPWWGIYRFKSGFGGKLITYQQSFDLIIKPFLYKIFTFTNSLRWKIIRVKRQLFR